MQSIETKTTTADYISNVTAELAVMAASAKHDVLAHLLQMVRLESEQICGRLPAAGLDTDLDAVDDEPRMAEMTGMAFGSSNVVVLAAPRAKIGDGRDG